MMKIALALAASLAVLLLSISHATAVVPITACGTQIPPHETGVLAADLDCSAQQKFCQVCGRTCVVGTTPCTSDGDCVAPNFGCVRPPAITIEKSATLDMNGHSVSTSDAAQRVIQCGTSGGRCTILSSSGRGDVSGHACIVLGRNVRAIVSDIDVHDCDSGIQSGYLTSSNVLTGTVEATNVTSNRNRDYGIRARTIKATNVTANENNTGLSADPGGITGAGIVAMDNSRFGAYSTGPFRITELTATRNGFANGIFGAGFFGGRGGRLYSSTLTGNVFATPGGPSVDLLTIVFPRLSATSCGTSGGKNGLVTTPWGVCADD